MSAEPKPTTPITPAATKPARTPKRSKPTGCSLTLRIGPTEYKVRPIEPDGPGESRAFRLSRAGAEPYRVARTSNGYRCSCPDAQFRHHGGEGRECKHVRACRAVGLL